MECWPQCDVEIRVEVDPNLVTWPKGSLVAYGSQVNLVFEDFRRATWAAAHEVLAAEDNLSKSLREQMQAGGIFEDVFSDAEEEFALMDLSGLDPGVAGAVLALNAAGCPTIYSCNGHQVGYPYIAFWTRRDHLSSLIESARAAEVGLINGIDGCVEVFADRRNGLIRFGLELAKQTQDFKTTLRSRGVGRRRQMRLLP